MALGVANTVIMLEYAIYSVITPEGCASILWKDSSQAPAAASALKLTSRKLLEYNLIDSIVEEPLGGAHYDWDKAACLLKSAVMTAFNDLGKLSADELTKQRYEKFSRMGDFLS